MSALAGVWNFEGGLDGEASCKRMLAAQEIYGPHDGRQWTDGRVSFGRRLFRTLPEDRYDWQPLVGAEGNLVLVADVRLDNREDLAAGLNLSPGASAQLCDAALLLACLERWNEDALDRLVGDFAFALWDSRAQKLLLARDFLGQRPLHYHCGKQFFAFATMPKGLHALADIPYAPDEQAMAEFVAMIPEGGGARSFFKDIAVVRPGHCLTVTRDGIQTRRYWNPRQEHLAREGQEKDFVEGLRHHLDLATRARLRGANGTVGTHLSGGFDSAAVTATAARLLEPEGGRVVAFTAVPREGYDGGVPEGRIADEGPLAAATVTMYPNIEHVLIRTGHVSPLEGIDRNFYLYDRPTLNLCNDAWGSAIAKAGQERKLSIMLTGHLGNMTLSYNGLELMPELLRAGRLLELLRIGAQVVGKDIMRWRGVLANTLGPYLPAWLWQRLTKLWGRELDVLEYTAIRPERLTLNLGRLAQERNLDFAHRPRKEGFETRLWVMGRVALGNYHKGLLAGWGIDQRDPTADKRLVEYCLGVPMDQYLARGETRALARRALRDRLPRAVIEARGKGYQAADWHESLATARGEIEAEVNRFAQCGPAVETLDVARLRAMLDKWPRSGWERTATINAYRFALLRGVSAGHFLRKAGGVNR